jgi:hypothetical protein
MEADFLRRVLRLAASLTIVTPVAFFGQVSSTSAPLTTHSFDVVSIKPSAPGEMMHYGPAPTGYSAEDVTIRTVLAQAFFPRNWSGKIVGAPDWGQQGTV